MVPLIHLVTCLFNFEIQISGTTQCCAEMSSWTSSSVAGRLALSVCHSVIGVGCCSQCRTAWVHAWRHMQCISDFIVDFAGLNWENYFQDSVGERTWAVPNSFRKSVIGKLCLWKHWMSKSADWFDRKIFIFFLLFIEAFISLLFCITVVKIFSYCLLFT